MENKILVTACSLVTFISLVANAFNIIPIERLDWEGDDLPDVQPVYDEADDYWGYVSRNFDRTLAYSYTDNGEDSTSGEQCWEAKIKDTSTISYNATELGYPIWKDAPDLCQKKEDEWDAFEGDVYDHEIGHAQNITDWDGGRVFDGYKGKDYFESEIHTYTADGVGSDDNGAKQDAEDKLNDIVEAYLLADVLTEVDGIVDDYHANRNDRGLQRYRNCDGTISPTPLP